MDIRKLWTFFLTGIIICCSFQMAGAQPVVKTAVDKKEILIGEQFKVTIQANFSTDEYKMIWPAIPDSLQHFEVISRKLDSLYLDNRLVGLTQTITFTSFDSGKWILPAFLINMVPVRADNSISFFTDTVPITVAFSTSDTTNLLKDIKTIREVETMNPIWYWVGAGVLLIALIVFLIWFYKFWKKNKGIISFQNKTSPFDEAMKEMENLKIHNLSVAEEIKMVHARLGEITKRYLTQTLKNNYENKTTGDILILLRDRYLEKDLLAKASASLRCTDAVKFAKYLPPVNQSEEVIQQIKEVIQAIHLKQREVAEREKTIEMGNKQRVKDPG